MKVEKQGYDYTRNDMTIRQVGFNSVSVLPSLESPFIMDFDKCKKHKDGRITATLTFDHNLKEGDEGWIVRVNMNITSLRTITEISTKIHDRIKNDWDIERKVIEQILEDAANLVVHFLERGEPILDIGGDAKIVNPSYLVEPLVYKGLPNILYGEGGTIKSIVALTCCILCKLGLKENPFEFKIQPAIPLFLDYEFEPDVTENRIVRICNGLGSDKVTIKYRRCRVPLMNEIDKIQDLVETNNINFLVIDSLGMAAGTDSLKEAKSATDFFSSLGQLKCSSLIIAHPPKSNGEPGHSSPYGTAFFSYLARNVWECRKSQEVGEDEMDIAFVHTKTNLGKIYKPFGIHASFADESITMFRTQIENISSFNSLQPIRKRIADFLGGNGMQALKDIVMAVGANQESVRQKLYQMKKDDEVLHLEQKWGLKVRNEEL